MNLFIPDAFINAFWGAATILLGVAGAFLASVKTNLISIGRKHRAMDDFISAEEFEDKLHVHCAKRQQSLDAQLVEIKDTLRALGVLTSDISNRLIRMETISEMDHK